MRQKMTIGDGLLHGRIRANILGQEPSTVHMAFDDALAAASPQELLRAAERIIRHPNAKYTHRHRRLTEITRQMMRQKELTP